MNRSKRKLIICLSSFAFVLAIIIFCAIYLGTYYRADNDAIEAFAPMDHVDMRELDDGAVALEPHAPSVGLIFYPGGKVEHTAYLPLLSACAEQGILSILVEMPFNLAVFDVNAAEDLKELYPEIEHWYIGGHSLGGSMAASYLAKHPDEFEGLILLGSYSTADLSNYGLKVLSVYGSEDTVMNKDKYEENKQNLPADFEELVIDGGNHAGFGMYGSQDGDGSSSIGDKQLYITADEIAALADIRSDMPPN